MKAKSIKIFLAISLGVILSATFIYAQDYPLAPDFKLKDVYQSTVDLSTYKGRQPVVIYFWGIWHPDSAKELQMLNDAYAGLIDDDIEVFAINAGDVPEDVDNFIKNYNLSYPVLLDIDTRVTSSFSVDPPGYVIINKKGEVVFNNIFFPYGKYEEYLSN